MNNFSKVIFLGLAVGLFNPAIANDLFQGGGYNNSSSDFPHHVTASASPRALVTADTGHHNDGGQDRSGQNWTKEVASHAYDRKADAPSSPLLRERGWNSK